MPIAFNCPCGRAFNFGDARAGMRTKCPQCGEPITVPTPAAVSEPLSDEDKAFQALAEAPDAEPTATSRRRTEYEDAPRPAPARAPIPAATRGPTYESRRPDRSERSGRGGTSGIHLTPAVWGGLFSMLLGGGFTVLALSNDRISIFGPIIFLSGLVAVVRGLLGHSEE